MRRGALINYASMLVSVAGMAGTFAICNLLVERERVQLHARTDAEAWHIAAQIRSGVLSRSTPLEKLGEWWLSQGKPLAREDWQTDASLFLPADTGLREAMWLDRAYVMQWSVRPGQLPDTTPRPAPAAMASLAGVARSRRSMALSPVTVLEDGRPGVYICAPVLRPGRLRGYVVGAYDLRELLDAVLRNQFPQGFHVAVLAGGRTVYQRDNAAADPEIRRTVDLEILNAAWKTQVSASAYTLRSLRASLLSLGAFITALLYLTTAAGVLSRRRAAALEQANAALQSEIRERQRAEERIAELNRDLSRRLSDFQTLIDVIPIGIAVAEDAGCRNIWINPALADLLGVPQPAGISRTPVSPADPQYSVLSGGRAAAGGELPMQVAARTGAPVLGRETRIVRPDGKCVHILSYAAPLFDETGRVRGVLNACVDITGRKIAEQERRDLLVREQAAREQAEKSLMALQASEMKFRRLIDSDVIGVFIGDESGVIEANDLFLETTGYDHLELGAGRITWSRLMRAREGGNAPGLFTAELLSTGTLRPFEVELVRRDGSHVPVLMGGALVEGAPDGKCICFVLDLTGRRDLEQRLQRAEKLKSLGIMAGGISHDFNNLLTGILGNAGLALEQLPEESPARPLIGAVLSAGDRAAGLVAEILAYTGKAFHAVQPIDLSSVLDELRRSPELAAPPGAELVCRLAAGLPRIRADETELRRVVINVLLNAFEALEGKPGRVEIATGVTELTAETIRSGFPDQDLEPGLYTRLEISDTGCGMEADVMARMFDPFFTTKFTGRGLGLSAVQGILRAHRAGVRVESSVHAGTRFELLFPAVMENGVSRLGPAREESPEPSAPGRAGRAAAGL